MERSFWKQAITDGFQRRNLVWLAGVRRVGKTTLCQGLEAIYYDCELPSVRSQLSDPEFFWRQHEGKLVVLDEVHRLVDPSNVLKIATDHFRGVRVVATGSSTLAARRKFKDTLTDRKHDVWMQPLLASELPQKSPAELDKRLLRGGLPGQFLAESMDDRFYVEWLDSFWAKDVQELFVIERKTSFLKFAEMLLRQSGELFEANAFAAPCEVSRQTVQNYLAALETTLFATAVRPFTTGRSTDLVRQPKVYGFDTGFVCFSKGIDALRDTDRGHLLEHLVLEELLARVERSRVRFWRDKQKHKVDFIIAPLRGSQTHAIECKWTAERFDEGPLTIFRKAAPHGRNIVVAGNIETTRVQKIGTLEVTFCAPGALAELVEDL